MLSSEASPKVSVIVLSRNRFEMLDEALKSVADQDLLEKIEVILVDESDEEGLEAVLEQHQSLNIDVIRPASRLGIPACRNLGLERARGEFVAFLDADDSWTSGYLSSQLRILREDSRAAGVVCASRPFFSGPFRFFARLKIRTLVLVKNSILLWLTVFNRRRLPVAGPFLVQLSHAVFRRQNLPKFPLHFKTADEWFFCLEILKRGVVLVSARRLVWFRYSAGSFSFSVSAERGRAKREAYSLLAQAIDDSESTGLLVSLFRIYSRFFVIKEA